MNPQLNGIDQLNPIISCKKKKLHHLELNFKQASSQINFKNQLEIKFLTNWS